MCCRLRPAVLACRLPASFVARAPPLLRTHRVHPLPAPQAKMICDAQHILNISEIDALDKLAAAKKTAIERDGTLTVEKQAEAKKVVASRIGSGAAATAIVVSSAPQHFNKLPEWLQAVHSVNTQKNFGLKNKVNLHHYISTEIGAFSAGVHPDDVRFQLKHRKPGYALVGQLRKVVTDYYGGCNKDLTGPLPNETFVKMCELYRADENVQLVQTWVRACCCHPPFFIRTHSHTLVSPSRSCATTRPSRRSRSPRSSPTRRSTPSARSSATPSRRIPVPSASTRCPAVRPGPPTSSRRPRWR